jgi:contactin associated protein-like 2
LKADNDRAETRRILEISTGNDVMIGGGIYGQKGFIGCLKQITIDGDYKPPSDWTSQVKINI